MRTEKLFVKRQYIQLMDPGRSKDITVNQTHAGRIKFMAIRKSPCLYEQIRFIDLRKIFPMVQNDFFLPLIPYTL